MDVRNCRVCGRIFNYLSGPPVCQVCKENADMKFQEVKEYVRENRGATINEVAEANDVTPKQIKQWVKEERLQFADDSPVVFQCETCGASIKTGRYCDACKKNQGNVFAKAAARPEIPKPEPKKQEASSNKMRHFS